MTKLSSAATNGAHSRLVASPTDVSVSATVAGRSDLMAIAGHKSEPPIPGGDKSGIDLHDGERMIDLPAVLRKVPIARSTLFSRIRDGSFPAGRKIGRRRLWRLSVVDDFLRNL